jgi:hypothetical protein
MRCVLTFVNDATCRNNKGHWIDFVSINIQYFGDLLMSAALLAYICCLHEDDNRYAALI